MSGDTMLAKRLTDREYRHIAVSPTAVAYEKTISRPKPDFRRPDRVAPGVTVNMIRLIVERKGGGAMPDIYLTSRRLHELKAYADFSTKEYLSVARNHQGAYLLEVPILPANIRVCERFAEWLDNVLDRGHK